MKRFFCLLLLFPVLSSVASTPRLSWKIEIETSGGLTGRGVGNISVGSDGRSYITTETGDCRRKLVAHRLKQVSRAVTRATPAKWRQAYSRPDNPRGAADQIRYSLRLTLGIGRRARVYETYWFDETQERLPADLSLLVETLRASRDELLKVCAQ